MTFKIPKGLFDQSILALGKTRSGKSSKLRVYVEHLLKAGEPVCILDVKGEWWGIKSSADGKGPGFPMVIFGGKHADLPLNPAAGKELAEVIFTGNRPCIIDMKALGMQERSRLFIDFTSRGFQVNQGKRYLAITEVHNFAFKGKVFSPQAGEMLHWANKLASEGLGVGINLLADSQRGQKVHNDFLSSMETLIACKVIHKADRDAIKDWIDGCADISIGKQVLDSLAQLKKPQAWVWCPEIEFGPELVEFPMFSTYDSFKPQGAQAPAQLKGWASVNLDELKGKLANLVEEAKANDPAALKKRIAELERQLKAKPDVAADPDVRQINIAHNRGFQEGQEQIVGQLEVYYGSLDSWAKGMPRPPTFKIEKARAPARTSLHDVATAIIAKATRPVAKVTLRPRSNGHANVSLPPGELAILTACIQFPGGLRREQLTVLTQYKRSSRDAYIQRLREKGLVETSGDMVKATDEGTAALPDAAPLPTGVELQEHWMRKLPSGEAKILQVLINAYPSTVSRDSLTESTGFARSSRDAYLQRMKAKQLWTEPSRGEVRASEDLF